VASVQLGRDGKPTVVGEGLVESYVIPVISRPVCLGIKRPSGAYGQIFITVRQSRVCWCGALSLTRGRVCRLQLLLAVASAVILGSESRGTRDHIILSQIRDFSFRRLLRLTGGGILPHLHSGLGENKIGSHLSSRREKLVTTRFIQVASCITLVTTGDYLCCLTEHSDVC
jgi:hypothetical protein